MAAPFTGTVWNITDASGNPISGAKVYTYAAGTLTAKAVYTDASLSVASSNPVIADTSGRVTFFLGSGAYRFRVFDANDVEIPSLAEDNVTDGTSDLSSSAVGAGSRLVAFVQRISGAVASWVETKLGLTVSAHDFMTDAQRADVAAYTGSIDVTAAINAALASGRTVELEDGAHLVLGQLNFTTAGQKFRSKGGRTRCYLKVTSSSASQGVLYFNTSEPGPHVEGIGIQFTQPDTATRASLTTFPPAIYARSVPRFRVKDCRISNASVGIDMQGNSGGAVIDGLEISSFDIAIDIDGSLDSVRISNLQWWPFDLTSNRQSIFYDSSNVGIKAGRADDLHITNGLLIGGGKQIWFYQSASGTTFGNIVGTDFDSLGNLTMSAGNVNLSASIFTSGAGAPSQIDMTGGYLRISGTEFEAAVAGQPMIKLSGTGQAYATLSGCMFRLTGDMQAISLAASSGNSTLVATGNQFIAGVNATPTNAIVNVASGGRLTLTSSRFSDKGTGTGNGINITTDDGHMVKDNTMAGWGITVPAGMSTGIVMGNQQPMTSDFSSNILVGGWKIKRFTGSLTAGAATVAHGITAAQQKGLFVQAFQRGGSGEMSEITCTVDGTNLNLIGGSGTAAYRVSILYTESQQGW